MKRAATVLVFLLLAAAAAAPTTHAGQQPAISSPASPQGDIQKWEEMRTFGRARNARDYASTTPDAIDEAGT